MVDSLCDTITTVFPLLSRSKDFKIIPSFNESRLLVGSSKRSTEPLCKNALAIPILCFSPPESTSPSSPILQVDTIRFKRLKIAAKLVRSARYLTFKLCSHCPYKNEFYEILEHICGLKQLE